MLCWGDKEEEEERDKEGGGRVGIPAQLGLEEGWDGSLVDQSLRTHVAKPKLVRWFRE